jgi:LPXTG-motif cell wall-anchored protein
VRVEAAASGWYDVPPTYATRTTTTRSDGTWHVTFPMPAGVASVTATCGGSAAGLGTIAPVPAGGHYPAPTRSGDRFVVSSAQRPEVFGPDGTPVPTTPVDATSVSFAAHDLPARVVVLGRVEFGENAEAHQVSAPEAKTYDIPAAAQAQPTASPTPSPTPTATPTATDGAGGGAGELPTTGSPLALLVVLGLAGIAAGAGLVRRT